MHAPVVTNIAVEVADPLPELFFLESSHSYGRWSAGVNAGFSVKPQPTAAFLPWTASIQLDGVRSEMQIDRGFCSYINSFALSKDSGPHVYIRFRKVFELGYDFDQGRVIGLLRDHELEEYAWLWAFAALQETGLLAPPAVAFMQQAVFPDWSNGYYNTQECRGFTRKFFEDLTRFTYEHGIMTDLEAEISPAVQISITGKNKAEIPVKSIARVRARINQLFDKNLVLTLRKKMTKAEGEAFISKISPRMQKWLATRKES